MELNYVTIEYAITANEKVIKISGGLSGVKIIANIESPLDHIKNDDYYPSFEEKLTHLVFPTQTLKHSSPISASYNFLP